MADKSSGSDMREALDAFLSQVAAERPPRPVTPLAADSPKATPPAADLSPAAPTDPTPTATSTGHAAPPGKEELLAAYDRLVEHEATKPLGHAGPAQAPWKRLLFPAVGVLSAVATVYLWIAKPEWLYPTFEPSPPPETATEAQLQLVAASILVEQYHQETGHFPTSFADLGLEAPSLSITPDAGGYRIIGGTSSQPMFLRGAPGQPSTLENFPR
ncbi:MAG: hypothetical protein ACKVZ0_01420 [Gemmatimonadales bacterium]